MPIYLWQKGALLKHAFPSAIELMKPSFLWLSFPKLITVLLQLAQIKLFLTFPSYMDSLVSRSTQDYIMETKSDILLLADHLLQQLHIPDMSWMVQSNHQQIN